jgi:4-hydroxy-tetrahydrodipicolinate synthase
VRDARTGNCGKDVDAIVGERGASAFARGYGDQLPRLALAFYIGVPIQNVRGAGALARIEEVLLKLEGVYSVLPTPFRAEGNLDEASLRRVVDLFVGAGVNGVTALGVTGEVARLDESERRRVLEIVVQQADGRIGVVAGTTADGTRTCIAYSRQAKEIGATAVMVSPPRMPKLNSDAVVRHYAALADAVDVEIVVQDYPPISGYAMEPALLARIAQELPAARTIKLEDPPTPFKTSRILERTAGLDVRIFGGLGGVFLLEELLAGATGAMTGFAFPELLVQIVSLYRSGRIDDAGEVFYRAVPLMRFEFQEGIGMAIRKELLHRRGALATPATRAPAAALDQTTREALDRVMAWSAEAIQAVTGER